MLAISTESWHYAYWKWLRGLYGYGTKEQTSLCPYCQTILWGSIFCIVLSPLLLSGWLMMRLSRWMMKLEGSRLDKFFSRIEDMPIGKAIEKGPVNFAESPLMSGFVYTVMGVAILSGCLVILGIIATIISTIGMGIWNIADVLAACWSGICTCASGVATGFLYIGWTAFNLFGIVGWAMSWIGFGFGWLFTNGELWTTIGTYLIYVVVVLALAGIAAVVVGYVSMIIARTKFVQGVWTNLVTRVNGFAAARKARQERVKEARLAARKDLPPIKCYYCNTMNEATEDICSHCDRNLARRSPEDAKPGPILAFIFKSVETLVFKPIGAIFGSMERFGKQEIHLLGWAGIIVEFIKAAKKGVCPIVEFTNPTELQERAREGAEERNA